MALTLDVGKMAGKRVDQLDKGDWPSAGRGMCLITDWKEYGSKDKGHVLELEIVAWPDANDVGKPYSHNLQSSLTEEWMQEVLLKQVTQIALATGIYTPAQIAEAAKANRQLSFDLAPAVGRPVFVELINEKDKKDPNKSYLKINNRGLSIFHIRDPRCQGWPINQGVLNNCAATVGNWTPLGSATTAAPGKATDPKLNGVDPLAGL